MKKVLQFTGLAILYYFYFTIPGPAEPITKKSDDDILIQSSSHNKICSSDTIKIFNNLTSNKLSSKSTKISKVSHKVLATKYNPVPEQCDSDPLITACNAKIDLNKLNAHKLRWIAVSRDLLKHYPYGTVIEVDSSNEKLNGKWIVMDTMNKRWKRRVDFLVPINDNYGMEKPLKIRISKCNDKRI